VWLALAVAAGAAALLAARAASRRGDEISGVAIVGLAAVLVSPVSWIHHMVWVVPAIGAIAGDGRNRQRRLVALGTAAFFVVPVPNRAWEPLFERYAPVTLQVAVQNSFVIAAALLVVILAMLPPPAPDAAPVPAPRPPDGVRLPPQRPGPARAAQLAPLLPAQPSPVAAPGTGEPVPVRALEAGPGEPEAPS
jgi:alpha-1,2-mannosyltransferase